MASRSRPSLPPFPAEALDRLLPLAFAEDEGAGDITSLATVGAHENGVAHLLCKQAGVIAGLPAVERIFRFRGIAPAITAFCAEGASVEAGTRLLTLKGPLRGLLVCERILLNFLQRLSGIATVTCEYVKALEGSATRLLDTRKTLPGYRALDKYAVALGGGENHRQGLFDQALIKDNHARACGSARIAVERVRARYGDSYFVEAEAATLTEVRALLDAPVDMLLLDNMDDEALEKAVALARKRAPAVKLEASGNMDLKRLRRIRKLGLDFISVGALTHSVRALDISLDFEDRKNPATIAGTSGRSRVAGRALGGRKIPNG